ncbi:uncharacterized protein LOC118226062 [Anguilla anguilla]|uniref:uncharacterized protein LOC118226062 n=1 Tax=Anguilla anguilla TaxID=7936 RepID=UPI0015A86753|nr:uncharacterized protein LOC118226062 [Anguilla anguilla]
MKIPGKPHSLDALVQQLEDKLGIPHKFTLQYEDPDFNNALVNLTDISDLPEMPTLKIISLAATPTLSTADAEILSTSSGEQSPLSRQSPWPATFEIPNFAVDVEYRLRQGNLIYTRDETHLQVPHDMKHKILEKLAETMYSFKAYPHDEEFSDFASTLFKKHPCLTEPGSSNGLNGWKNSLKFKMGNYRTTLRRAGCTDVAIHTGKRGSQEILRSVNRPKRFEINFLPNFPIGEDEISTESKRKELVEELKKHHPSATLISNNMDTTFALRRKELVHSEPPVKETLGRWPALFTESQVLAEFNRITSKNLKQEFFTALDRHTPRFLEIFHSKGGTIGQKFLDQITSQNTDIKAKRTVVLRGLPIVLGDEQTDLFKICFDCDDYDVSPLERWKSILKNRKILDKVCTHASLLTSYYHI